MPTTALVVLDGLTEAQKKAAIALAEGATRDDAAIAAGVDRTTVFRWLRKPEFVDAYKSLSQSSLEALLGKAVNCFENMLQSKNEWIRLNAARTIIERVMPNVEAENSAIHVEFTMPQPAMPPPIDPIEAEDSSVE